MSENAEQDQKELEGPTRVSKREFLGRVSDRSEIPARTVRRVYDTIIAELMDTMRRGDQLMLTGFGKFYPQAHKGHRVQFADNGFDAIDDYFVLKFSATRNVNKALAVKPTAEELEARQEFFEAGQYLGADEEGEVDESEDDDIAPETKPKARTGRTATSKASGPAPVSLASAAVQSTRAINRSRRLSAAQTARESTPRKPI